MIQEQSKTEKQPKQNGKIQVVEETSSQNVPVSPSEADEIRRLNDAFVQSKLMMADVFEDYLLAKAALAEAEKKAQRARDNCADLVKSFNNAIENAAKKRQLVVGIERNQYRYSVQTGEFIP